MTRASSSDRSATASPRTTFAIDVDGDAIGSVGFVLRQDVERVSAEIGYWLAEPFLGTRHRDRRARRDHRLRDREPTS